MMWMLPLYLHVNQKSDYDMMIYDRKSNMAAILKIYFFASSPELKSQLTRNFVGSIGVSCKPKIAKIFLIGNHRWPLWQPS